MNRDIRIVFICIITAITFAVTIPVAQAATSHEVELLWPNGAPGAKGTDEGDKPTLTIYLPEKEKATGAAVVIFPGGGYGHLAMDHEGHQIAEWLNSIGVAGFILKYRHTVTAGRVTPIRHQSRTLSVQSGWFATGRKSGTSIPIESASSAFQQGGTWHRAPEHISGTDTMSQRTR